MTDLEDPSSKFTVRGGECWKQCLKKAMADFNPTLSFHPF